MRRHAPSRAGVPPGVQAPGPANGPFPLSLLRSSLAGPVGSRFPCVAQVLLSPTGPLKNPAEAFPAASASPSSGGGRLGSPTLAHVHSSWFLSLLPTSCWPRGTRQLPSEAEETAGGQVSLGRWGLDTQAHIFHSNGIFLLPTGRRVWSLGVGEGVIRGY